MKHFEAAMRGFVSRLSHMTQYHLATEIMREMKSTPPLKEPVEL